MKMIGHDHFICHSYCHFSANLQLNPVSIYTKFWTVSIFPCFLTYFYPTGHDVPEEV